MTNISDDRLNIILYKLNTNKKSNSISYCNCYDPSFVSIVETEDGLIIKREIMDGVYRIDKYLHKNATDASKSNNIYEYLNKHTSKVIITSTGEISDDYY